MIAPSIQSMINNFLTMKTMGTLSRIALHEKSNISNGDRPEIWCTPERRQNSNQSFIHDGPGHRVCDQHFSLCRLSTREQRRHAASQAGRGCFTVAEAAFRATNP